MGTRRAEAALGFRSHTGWAAMVAVSGPPATPTVLHSARLEMIAGHSSDAPPFVYHAAARLPLPAAERLVRESAAEALAGATAAIAAAVRALDERGFVVVASGLVDGNRPAAVVPLERILAAHSLIHAAEGELFRQALAGASESCHIPVARVAAGELYARGARQQRVDEARLRARLTAAGRDAGKPWTADQKDALLVALLALAGAKRR